MGYIFIYFSAFWMATRETTPSNLKKIVGFNLLDH